MAHRLQHLFVLIPGHPTATLGAVAAWIGMPPLPRVPVRDHLVAGDFT